jgi:hypothetical protein
MILCTASLRERPERKTERRAPGEARPPIPSLTHHLRMRNSAARNEPACEADKQEGGWVWEGGGLRPGVVRSPVEFVAHHEASAE